MLPNHLGTVGDSTASRTLDLAWYIWTLLAHILLLLSQSEAGCTMFCEFGFDALSGLTSLADVSEASPSQCEWPMRP